MLTLKDKVAIVTGAAHPMGMGYATARRLADAGAKVVLTDRVVDDPSRASLEARAAEVVKAGGDAIAIAVDVTVREQIDACIVEVKTRYGGIDILFNNAGSPAGCGDFLSMSDQQWDISYQVNLKGVADFCQAVLPGMIQQGGGAIVNASRSILFAYAASEHQDLAPARWAEASRRECLTMRDAIQAALARR